MAEPKYCCMCKEYLYDDEIECPYCGGELSWMQEEPDVTTPLSVKEER